MPALAVHGGDVRTIHLANAVRFLRMVVAKGPNEQILLDTVAALEKEIRRRNGSDDRRTD
jgi:hypothetical protein